MQIEQLTPTVETVLQEILDHRFDNGSCDFRYWQEKLQNTSAAEDIRLRSIFKELKDAGMITTMWADNTIHYLALTDKGLTYFDLKKDAEKKEKNDNRSRLGRDILMLIIGAILGGLVQFLLYKFFGIGG